MRDQFAPYMNINFIAPGLGLADNTSLQNSTTAWGYSWGGFDQRQRGRGSRDHEQRHKRTDGEVIVRRRAQRLQSNPAITDAQKAALGITVPVLTCADPSTRCILRLFFADAVTPDSKSKSAEPRRSIPRRWLSSPLKPARPIARISRRRTRARRFTSPSDG